MRAHLFEIMGENDSKGYFSAKTARFIVRSVDDFKIRFACLTHALDRQGPVLRLVALR